MSDNASQSVHQPLIVVYVIVILIAVMYLARKWAKGYEKLPNGLFNRYIKLGAQLSFGIYLSQSVGMMVVRSYLAPLFTQSGLWVVIGLPLTILFVYATAFVLSYGLYQTPCLSYLVGRKYVKKGLKQS